MKKIYLAVGAFAIQSSVQADIEYNLAYALTASYSDLTLVEKDENGKVIRGGDLVFSNEWVNTRGAVTTYNFEGASKITLARILNREILEELIVVGGHDTSISGWALKLIIPSDEDSDEDSGEDSQGATMSAVKGNVVVPINAVLNDIASAEQYKYTFTGTYNEATAKSTERESGSGKFVTGLSVEIPLGDYLLDFATILSGNETLRFFGTGEDRFSAWVPSALAFTPIVGSIEDESDEEGSVVLQGSMRATNPKVFATN